MAAVMCRLCNSHIALQVPPLRRPRRGERSGGAGGTGGGGGGEYRWWWGRGGIQVGFKLPPSSREMMSSYRRQASPEKQKKNFFKIFSFFLQNIQFFSSCLFWFNLNLC